MPLHEWLMLDPVWISSHRAGALIAEYQPVWNVLVAWRIGNHLAPAAVGGISAGRNGTPLPPLAGREAYKLPRQPSPALNGAVTGRIACAQGEADDQEDRFD